MTDYYPKVTARFEAETKQHEMQVLLDQGLYRHIRFENAETGAWFALVTWPQKLVVNGTVGTYVLSRTEDMFALVRGTWGSGPNVDYWGEKLVSSSDPAYGFSQARLEAALAEPLAKAEEKWPGVGAAWTDLTSGWFAEYVMSDEADAHRAVREFEYVPDDAEPGTEPFRFGDFSHWPDYRDWDWKWIWSCHAIDHGVQQYDAWKAEQVAGGGSRG